MGNHLPEEIITDIISRLQFDTVLECKRVCKTWRTLMSHPSFAQLHLRRSLQLLDHNDDDDDDYHCWGTAAGAAKVSFISQIRFYEGKKEWQLYYGEYNDDEHDSYKELMRINHPPFDFKTFILHSSCNGLICLTRERNDENYVYICNPVRREYINLPRLVTETPLNERGCSSDGFGYFSKTNEYKFVRIYYKGYKDSVGQVYVYTLGSGCGWRNIGEINYRCLFTKAVFANGAVHWVEEEERKILSFDLADEEFRLLPSPPWSNGCSYYLWVLGGWICAFAYQGWSDGRTMVGSLKKKEEKGTNYDMMKEQGYQSLSWSLEFIIQGPSSVIYNVPFFLKKSCMILMLNMNRRFCRYDLKTKCRNPCGLCSKINNPCYNSSHE